MALHELVEIHSKEDWDRLRALGWRYIGQEDIGEGQTRVDFIDDQRDAQIAAYSPTRLLPDALFWTD